jgi:hypothetical protein
MGSPHGQVLMEMGHDDESYESLSAVLDKAREQGSKWSLWSILVVISTIERRRGNIEAVERALTEARENIEYISDNISYPVLRANFIEQPEINGDFHTIQA